jgi:hypothetical protein
LNVSGFNGGGIYTTAGDVLLDNVELAYNETQNKGGGIYADPGAQGTVTIEGGSNIHENACVNGSRANQKGGGIYLASGFISLDTVTIANNNANTGDGLYRVSGTTASSTNVTYTNDTAYVEP